MSHLSIRTNREDEVHIACLQGIWGLDRSESARKALALAASFVENTKPKDKSEILATSKFIGSCKETTISSTNYKKKIRSKLKKKYET